MAGRATAPRSRPLAPARARFAIVAARFNEAIVKNLVDGATRAFVAGGVGPDAVEVHWVPGSFELPLAAQHLAATRRYAGIACVGAVIKGETPHFDFVAGEAAAGVREVAMRTGLPVTFGVVTALTEAQAWARAGGDVANRGAEAAEAALEMAHFIDRLRGGRNRARPRPPKRRGARAARR